MLQTSESNVTPQANMAGHGLAIGGGDSVRCYAEEHGYIIGIMSVIPASGYQQGIPRHFIREDKFDYYWPEFAHIGEQGIYNKELYFDNTDSENDNIFGYIPRYAEYKYIPDSVHGDFRDNLDFWHLSRKFASRPNLNKDFIEMVPGDADRIFAVQSGEDHLWCQLYNEVKAERKMPYFGEPRGII